MTVILVNARKTSSVKESSKAAVRSSEVLSEARPFGRLRIVLVMSNSSGRREVADDFFFQM